MALRLKKQGVNDMLTPNGKLRTQADLLALAVGSKSNTMDMSSISKQMFHIFYDNAVSEVVVPKGVVFEYKDGSHIKLIFKTREND